MEELIERAAMFKAMGDPTRLRIIEFLRSCCCPVEISDSGDVRMSEGPTAGEICCHITGVERINSTISFHLKELRQAGLIKVERQGKYYRHSLSEEAFASLCDYLKTTEVSFHQKGKENDVCCE